MENNNFTLVLMVAGISSRFQGKIKQFEIVGPNGESLVEYSLNQALKAGFNKIIFIVGNKTEIPFKEKFGDNFKGVPIEYALQTYSEKERDKPWGTCDAICSIKSLINNPFVVCNGDDIYGEKAFNLLVKHLKESKDEATVAWRLRDVLPENGNVSRGIILASQEYLVDLKETHNLGRNKLPSPINGDSLCSMNMFALHPKTLFLLEKSLLKFKLAHKEDRKSECYLPVELANLVKKNSIKIRIFESNENWIGITNPGDEITVRDILKNYK